MGIARFPDRQDERLLRAATIAATAAITIAIARGDLAVTLPALTAAQSWALETVALIGVTAHALAMLATRRIPRAANDNAAAGRGGRPFPIAR